MGNAKQRILIADDSPMNQEILSEILGDQYDYLYAEDGTQVVDVLNSGETVDLILLDINMPKMDGFDVLNVMNQRSWIDEIPVIIVSAERDTKFIQRAYELGITDYINRPFNMVVVQRRVANTLLMYARQRNLVELVEDQVYEREKTNSSIINILSQVIESRNNESGAHTLHVRAITNLLLHELVKMSDRYDLSEADISMIVTLSAMHDIGKISVPEEILNKPGKLTPEEWEIMKSHTTRGDEILWEIPVAQNDPLMVTAHAICRWHHERWDGKGYPDGLKGDEIPISAQAVALADVYDALTSERCYKKAFSHEAAVTMICNGECGTFNPMLINCLLAAADRLHQAAPGHYDFQYEAHQMTEEMLERKRLVFDERTRRILQSEQLKREFYAGQCGGIQFEYERSSGRVVLTDWYASEEERNRVFYLEEGDYRNILSESDLSALQVLLRSTTKDAPDGALQVLIPVRGTSRWHRLAVRTLWQGDGDTLSGVIGQFTDIHEAVIRRGVELTGQGDDFVPDMIGTLRAIFPVVRLVEPSNCHVLTCTENGAICETKENCYALWNRATGCKNCTSGQVTLESEWCSKLEVKDGKIYMVLSKSVRAGQRDCVLEIAVRIDEIEEHSLRALEPAQGHTEHMLLDFYRDALTEAYSRRYLDNFLPNLEHADGVAILDADNFKMVNDTYGHPVGDAALRMITKTIQSCIRDADILIRYGGDEFLLVFFEIEKHAFFERLDQIREAVHHVVLPGYPDVKLDVSIGGVYQVYPLAEAITRADRKMYQNKVKSRKDPNAR